MKLVIPRESLQMAITTIMNIETNYLNCVVSFVVDKLTKTLTIISGQHSKLAFCNLPLEDQSTALQPTKFSLEGSFCKQLLNDGLRAHKPIVIDVEMERSSPKSVQVILSFGDDGDETETIGLRWCRCEKIDDSQLAFWEESQSLPTKKMSKLTAEAIVYEATGLLPFQYVELNHNNGSVRLQRNGEIEEKALPKHLKLPCNLVLDPIATKRLENLCKEPGVTTIEFAQQGEVLTLKTNNQTVTSLLVGVEDFYHKTASSYFERKSIVLKWSKFKPLLKKWLEINCINKSDNALLYIDDNYFASFAINDPVKCSAIFPATVISPSAPHFNCHLFSFHLKEIASLKANFMMKEIDTKLTIMETNDGEYFLAIAQLLNDNLVTYSIPIQKAEYHMPTVQMHLNTMKEKEAEKLKDVAKPKEVQQSLFDYPIMND